MKILVRAFTLGLALSCAILLAPNTSHGAAAGAGAVYWYNGNTLRNLTEAQLLVYTVGAIEGLVTGLDIADSKFMRGRINKCTDGMTSGQLGKSVQELSERSPRKLGR